MQRRLSVMTALAVIAGLCVTEAASAVVSSDTLAGPDCNSLAHQETLEEYEDGTTSAHEDDDWGVIRVVELEATGGRNSRRLELGFYGWHDEFGIEDGLPQPAVARNFFYNQGDDEQPMTRETTVVGESAAAVRLHLGDKRIIDLGTFKPNWDGDAGGGFGGGTGAWHLSIPLRKHRKKLRAHEYKAKGSRSRVSFTYKFPATRFVRKEYLWGGWGGVPGQATQTTDWTAAECELRSRRLRLSTR